TDKCEFKDCKYTASNKARLTYKIVVCKNGECDCTVDGALTTLNIASQLEKERYELRFKMNNKMYN
ncbi:MAG: hypothetical protein ACI4U6_02890, partial [Acutalibacteraceae bacterium]